MKKVKLMEATSDRVYSDIYGWVSSAGFFVEYEVPNRYGQNKKRLASNQVFIKKGNGHHYNATIQNLMDNQDELFYEGYNDYNGRTFYEKIEGSQITVSWHGITTKKELSKVEVYEIDTETPYRVLMDYEIHKGLLVMFEVGTSEGKNRAGTYVVTECFEQPNREKKLCIVEPLVTFEGDTRQAVVINTESKQLYTVPYAEYAEMPNELDVFNHPIREPELQPICHMGRVHHESSVKQTNLFWQPIEEASAYTVSLYYYNSSEQLKNEQLKNKLYLLQRFEIERNVHWLTIENLMGNRKFIVMLEAEDRQGNVIARTRGIDVVHGEPQWW